MQFEQSVFQTTFQTKLQSIKNILDQNPHPNIATIEQIIIHDNQEASGQYKECHKNLSQYLQMREEQQLSCMEIINILNQIIQGYMHLRKFDIVHRDLCLDSIFIEEYHDNIIVIKIASLELSSIGKTRLTSSAGRPLFQAPEIYYLQKEYDNKCDIYSLGIILYYMCYQQNYPIQQLTKQSLQEFHQKLLTNQYVLPQNSYITGELKDLLKQMLVYYPENRISWNELYKHQAARANYFIINSKFYIKLLKQQENSIDQFQMYDLEKRDYCSQKQNYSIASILTSLLSLGYLNFNNQKLQSINELKSILESLQQQQILNQNVYKIDYNFINVVNQIQLYLNENVNWIKIQQELQEKPKIKILSKSEKQPEQPIVVNQQQIQKDEEAVFSLEIGGQKVESVNSWNTQQNIPQFQKFQFQQQSQMVSNFQNKQQFPTSNPQQVSVVNQQLQQSQNQKSQQQTFPKNQTFAQPTVSANTQSNLTQTQFPIKNSNQQSNFIQSSQKPPESKQIFQNSIIQKFDTDNKKSQQGSFEIISEKQFNENFKSNFASNSNQFQQNQFLQNFPNTNVGFDKQQSKSAAQFQSKSEIMVNPNLDQPNQQQNFPVQSQSQEQNKPSSKPFENIPQKTGQNFSFQNQNQQINFQPNLNNKQIAQPGTFNIQSNTQNISQLSKGTTQFNNQPQIFKPSSNFMAFTQKSTTEPVPSLRSTMIKPQTQSTKEHDNWFELASNTVKMLEQQSNLQQYNNIFVSLLFLRKYLIQKLNGYLQNSNYLDQDNNAKIQKFSSSKNYSLISTLNTLEKANDQLRKQIEIQKEFLKNQECNEDLKSNLKKLFVFQQEMQVRLNNELF